LGFEQFVGAGDLYRERVELPTQMGGLGIAPISGWDGIKHRYGAFVRVMNFVDASYPQWLPLLEERYAPQDTLHMEFQNQIEAAIEDTTGGNRLQRQLQAAKKVALDHLASKADFIYRFCVSRDHATQALAAITLADNTDVGSRWLAAASDPFVVGSPAVSGLEFCEMVRYRTLSAFSGNGRDYAYCDGHLQRAELVNISFFVDHPETCKRNANVFTARHDALKTCLAQLVRKAAEPGVRVTVEPRVEGGRNPDIRVERNGETHYIDVVVACPTSEEAMRSGAKDTKGVAADLAEKRKIRQYEQRGQVVVSFAVESHGIFGTAAATKYLSRLSVRVSSDTMWKFYRDCSHILAFHLGRANLLCRQRCRIEAYPESGPGSPASAEA